MKLKWFVFVISMLHLGCVFAQSGTALKNQSFCSQVLHANVLYNIYLPPGYDTTRKYPVLFSLHGFAGNNNSSEGLVHTLDSLMATHVFPPTIVVVPDGGRSWYMDDYVGKCNYSTMFITELLPFLETHYAISNDKSRRAVMGVSMGGFGALRFAMFYPHSFGVCVSLMGAIATKQQICEDENYDFFHAKLYGESIRPSERANEVFVKNNPLYIVQAADPAPVRQTKWFIACCDPDYHSLPNALLHAAMRERNIIHQYSVNAGDHTPDCSNSYLPEALQFIKAAFEK